MTMTVLGTSEHVVSAWDGGKRTPGDERSLVVALTTNVPTDPSGIATALDPDGAALHQLCVSQDMCAARVLFTK